MILFNTVGKGTYWRALHLARSLVKRGHEVTVLATSPNGRLSVTTQHERTDGVTLVESPDMLWGALRSGWDPWNVLMRIGWSQKRRFDLVHAFETRPTAIVPALYWQRHRHVPLILDWCDWFGKGGSVEQRPSPLIRMLLRPVETFFEEKFRRYADATTVINSILRKKAIELGVPAGQILLLPNGANVTEIRPQNRDEVRRRLGLPAEVPIVGYTGAIFHQDAALMAATFNKIQATFPATQLLLIGYFNVEIERLVHNAEAVIRTGPVNYTQLADYVAACDVGWLPLRDSGANRGRFPMKVNDFMAAERPLVVTDVGDVGVFVREKKIGHAVEDRPGPLAQAMLDLLANPRLCREMGQRARHLAETELAWPVVTNQLEAFYLNILTQYS